MRVLLALVATAVLAGGPPPSKPIPDRGPTPSGSPCTLDGLHPLQVQLRLAEPMQLGQWLRVQLEVKSAVDLDAVQVTLRADRGLEVQPGGTMLLGAIAAEGRLERELSVRVPDQRHPLQLTATVRGTQGTAQLERARVLHLLPQGPHHPASAVAAKSMGRIVLEYRGAARKEQP
jgi:hypothetical protein